MKVFRLEAEKQVESSHRREHYASLVRPDPAGQIPVHLGYAPETFCSGTKLYPKMVRIARPAYRIDNPAAVASLLNHLVCLDQNMLRYHETQLLGGFEVNEYFESRSEFYGQITGF